MRTFRPPNNNGACVLRMVRDLRSAGLHVLHEKGPWLMDDMAERHLSGVCGHEGRSQRHMVMSRTANEDGDIEVLTVCWKAFEAFSLSPTTTAVATAAGF